MVVGLGIYSPYAAVVDYPGDGPQRFQLDEAVIATVNVTPTIAWRPHRAWSIGAGVSYVVGFAELSRIQDFAELSDLGAALERLDQNNDFGPQAPTGVRELDVMARPIALTGMWAHAATFHAGVAFAPLAGLRFGLTYQHGADLRFAGDFELDMDDDFFTQDLASQGLAYPKRVRGDAELRFSLPKVIRFAARWQGAQAALGVDIAYSFWSVVESFDVEVRSPDLAQPGVGLPPRTEIRLERNWQDTLGVDILGELRLTSSVLAYLRAGFRTSAVPDATIDAASPDGDRIVGVGGIRFRVREDMFVLADLGMQKIL
ncbi:MAG: outer membrane protein transport protein, partial [Myxococcota bacterium]